MSELVELQDDLFGYLSGWAALDSINIVQYRKARVSGEFELSMIHLTPRNGRSGCGILVEMPEILSAQGNAPAPQDVVQISAVAVEDPVTNFGDTGTQMDAESVARLVRRAFHALLIEGRGELFQAPVGIRPAEEFEGIAYRVTARLLMVDDDISRVTLPTISEAGGVVTLANDPVTPTATIYFTTDGSHPGPANDQATIYTAPFTVNPGTVVRWCAYYGDWLPSDIGRATIN